MHPDSENAARGHIKGKPGARWAFMQVFVIPDVTDPEHKRPYLTRLRIITTPLFGINIHKTHTPDGDSNMHNHPYAFLSIPLIGGYYERWDEYAGLGIMRTLLKTGGANRNFWRWNWMPLDRFHRITHLNRTPSYTLLIHGPRGKRPWGFMTPTGFVDAETYFKDPTYKFKTGG